MIKTNGIHHIAIMAADMRQHIDFFSDVLGARLVALFDMHGVPDGIHAFLHLSDDCYFSLVSLPEIDQIERKIGVTHAGTGAGKSAPGTMQHLAFKVSTPEDLLAMRDRIRSKGVIVMGPIDHGLCQSIYFAGPDGLALEIASGDQVIDAAHWVDPSVVAKCGISQDELQRFMSPDAYAGEGGAVPQPAYDPSKPHMPYPESDYQQLIALPDAVVTQAASWPEPPVK